MYPEPSAQTLTERPNSTLSVRPIRSRARRYPFIANIELTDVQSEISFHQRTCDLSLYGCQVTFEKAFSLCTKVRVRIIHRGEGFHALGKIVYAGRQSGLGIVFISIEGNDQQVLEKWLAELRAAK